MLPRCETSRAFLQNHFLQLRCIVGTTTGFVPDNSVSLHLVVYQKRCFMNKVITELHKNIRVRFQILNTSSMCYLKNKEDDATVVHFCMDSSSRPSAPRCCLAYEAHRNASFTEPHDAKSEGLSQVTMSVMGLHPLWPAILDYYTIAHPSGKKKKQDAVQWPALLHRSRDGWETGCRWGKFPPIIQSSSTLG